MVKASGLLSRRRKLVIVVVSLLAAWPVIAYVAARNLIVEQPLDRSDAIVILSGSSTMVERVSEAVKLFKEGRSSKIILTNDNQLGGWSEELQRNPFFYERALALLVGQGIPRESIVVLQTPVSGTYDEAVLLSEYSRSNQVHQLLLVTSAYHSRRALRTFNRQFAGSNVKIGLVAVAPGIQTPRPAIWWLYVKGWKVVAGEYLKLIYYWMVY